MFMDTKIIQPKIVIKVKSLRSELKKAEKEMALQAWQDLQTSPRSVTVGELAKVYDVSRTTFYKLIERARGDL